MFEHDAANEPGLLNDVYHDIEDDVDAGSPSPLAIYVDRAPQHAAAIAAYLEAALARKTAEGAIVTPPRAQPGHGGMPHRIGPFRIVRQIARGGQGVVYLAE